MSSEHEIKQKSPISEATWWNALITRPERFFLLNGLVWKSEAIPTRLPFHVISINTLCIIIKSITAFHRPTGKIIYFWSYLLRVFVHPQAISRNKKKRVQDSEEHERKLTDQANYVWEKRERETAHLLQCSCLSFTDVSFRRKVWWQISPRAHPTQSFCYISFDFITDFDSFPTHRLVELLVPWEM